MNQSKAAIKQAEEKAYDGLIQGFYANATVAALANGVQPRTIQRRVLGVPSAIGRPPTHTALDDAQELAVIEFIKLRQSFDMCTRLKVLSSLANDILKQAGLDRTVGPLWATRFVKRHPELHKRKQAPLATLRKEVTLEEILENMQEFRILRNAFGITDDDTWNMDETGFRIGVGKSQWVVSIHKLKKLVMTDADNRDYVTSTECINATGRVIPPLITLQGKVTLDKWADNDLDGQALLSTSDTGYSNDKLALSWLKHFDEMTRKYTKGDFRMLILDGYGSHLTWEFWRYAQDARIMLFRLVPHSTHITQPLDVGCFQPMKHWHAEALDEVMRFGETDFAKEDFLASFEKIRRQTFKDTTIRNAFRHTGLIPYNPAVIEKHFAQRDAVRRAEATPPPDFSDDPDNMMDSTPHKIREVVEYGNTLKRKLDAAEELSPFETRRFIKGSLSMAYHAQLTESENRKAKSHAQEKAARKASGSKQAQKGGVISISDIRARVQKKELSKTEKARADIEKGEKVLEKERLKAEKDAERLQAWFRAILKASKVTADKYEKCRCTQYSKLLKNKKK